MLLKNPNSVYDEFLYYCSIVNTNFENIEEVKDLSKYGEKILSGLLIDDIEILKYYTDNENEYIYSCFEIIDENENYLLQSFDSGIKTFLFVINRLFEREIKVTISVKEFEMEMNNE